jgi:GNAT superfamily N-acetyltransferase
MLAIESARPEDAGLLLELVLELAALERVAEPRASEEGLRAALFGDRPVAEAAIARLDGVPAGFTIYFPTYTASRGSPGLFLEDLYVRPQQRGQGIGRALLGYLARLAEARGYCRLEWVELDWNRRAIDFYGGVGATPVSGRTVFRVEGVALAQLGRPLP